MPPIQAILDDKMPYFVYRISEPRKLEHMDTKENYREARELVRSLRSNSDIVAIESIRMIFANNPAEAEKLLSVPRDERVIGED